MSLQATQWIWDNLHMSYPLSVSYYQMQCHHRKWLGYYKVTLYHQKFLMSNGVKVVWNLWNIFMACKTILTMIDCQQAYYHFIKYFPHIALQINCVIVSNYSFHYSATEFGVKYMLNDALKRFCFWSSNVKMPCWKVQQPVQWQHIVISNIF